MPSEALWTHSPFKQPRPAGQVPQKPAHPSSPHTLPLQSGVQVASQKAQPSRTSYVQVIESSEQMSRVQSSPSSQGFLSRAVHGRQRQKHLSLWPFEELTVQLVRGTANASHASRAAGGFTAVVARRRSRSGNPNPNPTPETRVGIGLF